MSDDRTVAEKLQAERETEQRVQTQAALSYLRGKFDAMNAEHLLDQPSLIAIVRHQIEALQQILNSGLLPIPPSFPKTTVDMGLTLLLRSLPER